MKPESPEAGKTEKIFICYFNDNAKWYKQKKPVNEFFLCLRTSCLLVFPT